MKPLKILIIEDEQAHFQLMKRAVSRDLPNAIFYHFLEALTPLDKLDEILPDVILVDYLVPGMNGIEFLEALNGHAKEIPIIMITGQGDESVAVQAFKLGAWDYLVKTPDFFKLLPSTVERVIHKRETNRSLLSVERRFLDLAENTSDWIWEMNAEGAYLYSNPAVKKILGYQPDEMIGMHFYDLLSPEMKERSTLASFEIMGRGEHILGSINRLVCKDGGEVIVETNAVPIIDGSGNVTGYRGIDRDITEREWAQITLRVSHTFLEIANHSAGMIPMLNEFIEEIQQLTGCDAAGVRILDAEGDIPYLAYKGFCKEFYELESPLSMTEDAIELTVRDD